jgi:mxaA protein
LLAPLLAASTAAWALPLQTVEPRAFGYTAGDRLERRVLIDPVRDGALDPASLPRPGRYGRWFQLREVSSEPDGVHLIYQIINTPPEPDRQNLPSLSLRVIGRDGRAQNAAIGPFTVAMTPVVHFGPYDVLQSTDVRPDIEPPPIDTTARRNRVVAYAATLLALVVVQTLPGLARRLGWRPAGPFARAQRALRSKRVRADDADSRRLALRCLHRALDETAGVTLALDNLDALFRAQPCLGPARISVQALLADSRGAFFAEAPAPSLPQLISVADQLAQLERQR